MENETRINHKSANPKLLLRKPDLYFAIVLVVSPFVSLFFNWNERNTFSFWLGLFCVATGTLILSFLFSDSLFIDAIKETNFSIRIRDSFWRYRRVTFLLSGALIYILAHFLIPIIPSTGVPEFLSDPHTPTPSPIYIATKTPIPLVVQTDIKVFTQTPTLTSIPVIKMERIIEWDFTEAMSGNRNYFLVTENCKFPSLPCWTDSPQGNYLDNNIYILKSYPIDLTGEWEHIYLFFISKFITESCCDKVTVFLNGNSVWERSGNQDWQQNGPIDLIPKYKNQTIQIRIELSADSGNNADGLYIQNFKIVFIAP